jgi:CBS domain-containing protein
MMEANWRLQKAIRRKMESDLSKKKNLTTRARHSRKAPPGSVLALKPSPALQIKPSTTVAEAAQLMAAKREDCVLVTDDDDRKAGGDAGAFFQRCRRTLDRLNDRCSYVLAVDYCRHASLRPVSRQSMDS